MNSLLNHSLINIINRATFILFGTTEVAAHCIILFHLEVGYRFSLIDLGVKQPPILRRHEDDESSSRFAVQWHCISPKFAFVQLHMLCEGP